MKHAVQALSCLVFMATWIVGMVLAQGGMKIVAIFIPPYGWYLIAEFIMKREGWI